MHCTKLKHSCGKRGVGEHVYVANGTEECISMLYLTTIFLSGNRFHVRQQVNNYVTRVSLKIFNVKKEDFGTYYCVAKNSLGKSDGLVKLSGK